MESKGPLILGVAWFLVIFSGGILLSRIYCKTCLCRGMWWDDHLMVVSWVLIVTNAISISVSVSHGFGRLVEDIDPQNLPTISVCSLISASSSVLAASISKTSFILTLMRITVCCARHFLRFAIVSMNILLALAAIFYWLECTPLSSIWDMEIMGKCWPESILVYFGVVTCGYSAFLNLVLSLLPWKLMEKLQMVVKEKLGVVLSSSFGIFATIAAIIKGWYIPHMASKDFSYDGADLAIWSLVEPSMIIIGGSIPMLRLLFPDLRSQYAAGSRNYGIQVTCGARGNCKTTKTVTVKGGEVGETLGTRTNSMRHDKYPGDRDEIETGSDKSILERASSPMPDSSGKGILQISEIKVEYSTRKQSDSHENYEMEDV